MKLYFSLSTIIATSQIWRPVRGISPFSQCPSSSDLLFDGECHNIIDAFDARSDVGSEFINAAVAATGGSPVMTSVVNNAFQTFVDITRGALEGGLVLYDQNHAPPEICVGDFTPEDVENFHEDSACNSLPLSPDLDWSIFSFSAPVLDPCGLSPGELVTLQGCLAVSLCDDSSLPTVAFAVNGDTAACTLAAVSGGSLAPVAKVAKEVVGGVAFGFSLHNSFDIPISLYTGRNKMYKYVSQPSYFRSETLQLDLTSFFGNVLKDATVSLSGTGVTAYALSANANSIQKVEEVIDSGVVDFFGTIAKEFNVQMSMQRNVKLDIDLPVALGKFLPSISLDIAEANLFVTSGRSTIDTKDGTVTLHPGLYANMGTSLAADIIQTVFEYVMGIAGATLVS